MNNSFASIYKLREIWEKEGILFPEPATMEDITFFSANNGLLLPPDIVAYFTGVNGTSSTYDEMFFRFFSLAEFKTVKDELGNWGGIPDYRNIVRLLDDHQYCFIFADHSIHLMTYAIRLYSSPSETNEIYVICGEVFAKIADSFTEFIALYLRDDARLYL